MTKSADKELLRASFKLEYPYERSPGPVIGKFFEELSNEVLVGTKNSKGCLLYTSPSPRDRIASRMPSSA